MMGSISTAAVRTGNWKSQDEQLSDVKKIHWCFPLERKIKEEGVLEREEFHKPSGQLLMANMSSGWALQNLDGKRPCLFLCMFALYWIEKWQKNFLKGELKILDCETAGAIRKCLVLTCAIVKGRIFLLSAQRILFLCLNQRKYVNTAYLRLKLTTQKRTDAQLKA